VRSLLVESGLRLRGGALPLHVSLNGQDYDTGDVRLVYHAQPSMLPLYGPADGGTVLTLNVSGVPAAAAAPAVFAATASALCRFNASGQSVTTAATFSEAGDMARCLTPPASDLSSGVLNANPFENATLAFETYVHLALNGAPPRPRPRPPPTAHYHPHAHAHAHRPPPTAHCPLPTTHAHHSRPDAQRATFDACRVHTGVDFGAAPNFTYFAHPRIHHIFPSAGASGVYVTRGSNHRRS